MVLLEGGGQGEWGLLKGVTQGGKHDLRDSILFLAPSFKALSYSAFWRPQHKQLSPMRLFHQDALFDCNNHHLHRCYYLCFNTGETELPQEVTSFLKITKQLKHSTVNQMENT